MKSVHPLGDHTEDRLKGFREKLRKVAENVESWVQPRNAGKEGKGTVTFTPVSVA